MTGQIAGRGARRRKWFARAAAVLVGATAAGGALVAPAQAAPLFPGSAEIPGVQLPAFELPQIPTPPLVLPPGFELPREVQALLPAGLVVTAPPLLGPANIFLVVWLTINALQLFDEVYATTRGGPLRATTVIVYYLWDRAFVQFDAGYAAAMAYVLFVVILVITAVQFRLARRYVHT